MIIIQLDWLSDWVSEWVSLFRLLLRVLTTTGKKNIWKWSRKRPQGPSLCRLSANSLTSSRHFGKTTPTAKQKPRDTLTDSSAPPAAWCRDWPPWTPSAPAGWASSPCPTTCGPPSWPWWWASSWCPSSTRGAPPRRRTRRTAASPSPARPTPCWTSSGESENFFFLSCLPKTPQHPSMDSTKRWRSHTLHHPAAAATPGKGKLWSGGHMSPIKLFNPGRWIWRNYISSTKY